MTPRHGLMLALSLALAAAIAPAHGQNVPPVPELPSMTAEGGVRHAGATIWFGSIGGGSPVILLHGGLSSSRGWGGQVAALVAAGHRVILIDSRGHGRITLGPHPLSYELMADDVVAVMDRLKLTRVPIIGWSDGAIVGLVLAMRHRKRVARVFAFGANMDQHGVRSDASQAPVLQDVGPRLAADYAALSPTPKAFATLHRAVRAMQERLAFSAGQLAAIRGVPITIAQGSDDEFITDAHAAYLARTIPGATLEMLPGVGHFAPWQGPEHFNRMLIDWLSRSR